MTTCSAASTTPISRRLPSTTASACPAARRGSSTCPGELHAPKASPAAPSSLPATGATMEVAPGVKFVVVDSPEQMAKEAVDADAIGSGDNVACDDRVLAAAKKLKIGLQIVNRTGGGGPFDANPIGSVLGDEDKRAIVGQLVGQAYVAAYNLIVHNREAVEHIADVLNARRELFGDERRQTGVDPLAHLDLAREHDDGAVVSNPDVGVHGVGGVRRCQRTDLDFGRRRQRGHLS